jgi:tetratricopeptide (TPR) repeat protein
LKPNGDLDERAHSFTNRLINKEGTLNDLHQVWNNRVVAYNNTIQSGRSQIVRYQFRVPESMKSGALMVTAQVNYRRFNQHFINFGLSKGYVQPVVTMVARTRVLKIGRNEADAAPDAADNPVWMRWNNYGIGLLDAQQYADSVRAFEQVAKLRPDYPDAYTNIALANFQWEKYDQSRTALEKALKLLETAKPGDMTKTNKARALYYMALVERNEGNLDGAIEDLKQVAEAFPESRDAHRELGFSYYQQHKYVPARLEYERVQAIDPDDLAAHYNLSILYRRLGMKDKATIEAAKFADQKDDPTANTYALEYLRKHDEIAAESVPWHVHSEIDLGNAKAGAGR